MSSKEISDEKKEIAIKIAFKKQILKKCDTCGDIYHVLGADLSSTYKYASTILKKGAKEVEIFAGNQKELTDIIKELPNDYPHKCHCKDLLEKED